MRTALQRLGGPQARYAAYDATAAVTDVRDGAMTRLFRQGSVRATRYGRE